MPRIKKHTPQVEKVRPYVEGVAKYLVDKLYGPDGPPWGTSLTEIEDLVLGIRTVLSERILGVALARQAAAQPEGGADRTCPGCQRPLDCPDANPRNLETRAGEAEWDEPKGHCTRCRRDFFPSVPKPGD